MNGDHNVHILDEKRLKSELAMFIWAQSEQRRNRQAQDGEKPKDNTAFLKGKEILMLDVSKLAGLTIRNTDLIARLKEILSQGKCEEIQLLDPKHIASKISTKA
jgi:hypothetical protein